MVPKVWSLKHCKMEIHHFPFFFRCTICYLAFPSLLSPLLWCSVWAKMSPKQWEDKWGQGASEGEKNRFVLHCSWGLLENVVGAPFHRSFLWGREKAREEDVLTWTALSWMKALPRSLLLWPTRPLLLEPVRFTPPAIMTCKSIIAI